METQLEAEIKTSNPFTCSDAVGRLNERNPWTCADDSALLHPPSITDHMERVIFQTDIRFGKCFNVFK